MAATDVKLCECGCGEQLTGKQKRFRHDSHQVKYWSDCRRSGALGKGLDALLPEKQKGKIHAAPVIGNPRLEPLLLAIMEKKRMTSLDLQQITGSMCIGTDMSEIRNQGYPIGKAKFLHKTDTGKKVYEYPWEGK